MGAFILINSTIQVQADIVSEPRAATESIAGISGEIASGNASEAAFGGVQRHDGGAGKATERPPIPSASFPFSPLTRTKRDFGADWSHF
jgi:hypothetical protein